MPVEVLFDYSGIDLDHVQLDREGIRAYIEQRDAVEQLDCVIWMDEAGSRGLGIRRVRANEWWVKGHIPGNPILPGIMLVETAAQFSSIIYRHKMEKIRHESREFLAFAGIERARFRAAVYPGDELLFVIQERRFSRRRIVADVQAFTDFQNGSRGKIVFEAQMIGMPVTHVQPIEQEQDGALVVVR